MKNASPLYWLVVACALCLPLASASAANALVGLDGANQLVKFNSAAPATVATKEVTGLGSDETLIGIDYRPASGRLYGLTKGSGNKSRIYVINPDTAVASLCAQLAADPADSSSSYTGLSGTGFGVDFDPVLDRLRVVSDDGQNLRVDVDTGLVTTDVDISPGAGTVAGAAYSNSFVGTLNTVLYGIDVAGDRLVTVNPLNNGTLVDVGSFGADATGVGGFDILSTRSADGITVTSTAFAALTVSGSSALYGIDLSTGALTLVGAIGNGASALVGLTAEIPTPSPTAFAITNNHLIRFNVATPNSTIDIGAITGVTGGETIIGFDFRPSDGQLYLVTKDASSNGHIYTLNTGTAIATIGIGGGQLTAAAGDDTPYGGLMGTNFGVDFDPVLDRLRIVSDGGQNLWINLNNLSVTTDGNLNSGATATTAVAYGNNHDGAIDTTLYTIDTGTDKLFIQNGPNNGSLFEIGALGMDATGVGGFDIHSNGDAYATLEVGGSTSLYRIDIATGAATNVGAVSNGGFNAAGLSLASGGSLSFESGTVAVSKNAGMLTLKIQRTGGTDGTATVLVKTADGTALDGSDYTGVSSAVVFGPGVDERTVDIPIIGDTNPTELPETFRVMLSEASVGAISEAANPRVTVTINSLADIAVQQSVVGYLTDGDTVAFGDVGLGATWVDRDLIVWNHGGEDLTGLSMTLDGADPAAFKVIADLSNPIEPNHGISLKIGVVPTSKGAKTAVLHIGSNDLDEPSFDLILTANVVTAVAPVVTTKAATGVLFDTATVNGSVNAKGSVRLVFVDYGTTKAFGEIVTVGSASGNAVTAMTLPLAGLQPRTKYYFRIRAVGALGSATGSTLNFTTLDHSPTAVNDSVTALPSAPVTVHVLSNDTDPDGDALKIVSFTQPGAAKGKVSKVGTDLVFTPSASFAGGGSFTYIAGDTFGEKSAPATVSLVLGTCILSGNVTVPADSGPYYVAVTANTAWTVVEKLPWMSFTPPQLGDNVVLLIPAPNPSMNARTGTLKIGGEAHTVTQNGISAVPILSLPAPIPTAAVSSNYDLAIPTQNGPVTYTVTGLPAGMTLSNTTGHITGFPTTPKVYHLSISAKNAKGPSVSGINFDIEVLAFPPELVGSYSATVEDTAALTDELGGLMTMTVTGKGSVTGSLKLGAGSHAFTGMLNTAVDPLVPDPDHAVLTTMVTRKGKAPVLLTVSMNSLSELITGSVSLPGTLGVYPTLGGSKHVWSATRLATDYDAKAFTVSLAAPAGALIPQGNGFLTLSVSNVGAVTWSGELSDGTVISPKTATLWKDGELPLFALLYSGKGSLNQSLSIATTRVVSGLPHWIKLPQPPKVRAYAAGFGPVELEAMGDRYVVPASGHTLLNITAPGTAKIDFFSGGINSVDWFADLDQTFSVSPTHVATFNTASAINPAQVKLTKIDVVKGTFKGTLTLNDINPFNVALPLVKRVVTFQGVLLPTFDGNAGEGIGYFLLPAIAGPPANVTTSAQTSGCVRILK